MRKLLATIAGVLGLAAQLAASPCAAQQTAPSFEQVLEGARKEAKLVAWIFSPAQPTTHRAVVDAFNQRFGLDIKVDWVPTSAVTANTRAIAEAHGGKVSVDIIAGSEEEVSGAIKAGLIKPYPWSKVFEGTFPEIAKLEARIIPEYRGSAIPYLDVHYGLAWNPNFIKDEEVPAKLTDLADVKWQGKFGLNSIFLIPLPIISPFLGVEETLNLAQRMVANKPVYSRGTPAVAQSIVNGAVPLGVTIFTSAETSMRANQPLRFKLFSDYIPISVLHLFVPENSPNPNTARLFSAWFATEGYKVADRFEPNPKPGDADSKIAQMTEKQVAAGATLARMRSAEDLVTTAKVREAVSLMLSGQR